MQTAEELKTSMVFPITGLCMPSLVRQWEDCYGVVTHFLGGREPHVWHCKLDKSPWLEVQRPMNRAHGYVCSMVRLSKCTLSIFLIFTDQGCSSSVREASCGNTQQLTGQNAENASVQSLKGHFYHAPHTSQAEGTLSERRHKNVSVGGRRA